MSTLPEELILTDDELAALTPAELKVYYAALEQADEETWELSDRQQYADDLADQVDDLLYGGAAGGGKSEWALHRANRLSLKHPGHKTLALRRTFPRLRDSLIERSLERFDTSQARYHSGEKVWKYANGSKITFGYCDNEEDVSQYLSTEYDLIIFDELTEFTERMFTKIRSRCRTRMVKRRMGVRPHVIAMTNPGQIGHVWVKRYFVTATDYGQSIVTYDLGDGYTRTAAFVPAKVSDNPHIDPDYVRNLRSMDEVSQRQYLHGDWDVFEGQFFTEFDRGIHVIEPFAIPKEWPRATGIDYGYTNPMACLWAAFDQDGRPIVYRELYETKLTPGQQANRILAASNTARERITYNVLDPSCWAKTGIGDSIHDQYRREGLACKRAMNARRDGWARVREFLKLDEEGKPGILFFETCSELLRTLPELIHDDTNPEDLDTDGEDHLADALRYLLMSRPPRSRAKPKEPRTVEEKIAARIDRMAKRGRGTNHPIMGKTRYYGR